MELTESEIKELLSNYFPNTKEEIIEIFLSISKYGFVHNKELILKSTKYDKNVLFILKGVTRAYNIDEKGQELNKFIRAEGHLVGDSKVFDDTVQPLHIESINDVHYLKFDIHQLEKIGLENTEVMNFYLFFLKEIILTLSYRLSSFITMTTEKRYLDLTTWNPILLETAYDKHIATFLGTTPLTIHRIKKKHQRITKQLIKTK